MLPGLLTDIPAHIVCVDCPVLERVKRSGEIKLRAAYLCVFVSCIVLKACACTSAWQTTGTWNGERSWSSDNLRSLAHVRKYLGCW